jgi:RNA polymerase sigma-70 factor, ECF subfamily
LSDTSLSPRLPDPDILLVERCLAGDQKAFEYLVVKYQARIERLVGRLVRDVDLVPDIAQETFIKAYRALPSFRGEARFYTWLYRIAINTAKKQLMELKKDPLLFESAMHSEDPEDETSAPKWEQTTTETPEAVLASRQIADAVNQALDELPQELRQALVLREMEGMSYEEISQAMGSPVGTVRSRIFRAREAISLKIKPMLNRQNGKRW